ncbi:VOC family protein [Micromonospora sp. NPDC023966]|uniref:VOC family protein n=1 Tax=Micromonospora sp. NPDC023966 TaxID=3154699 RepID=UPI0033CC3B1B
MPESGSRVAARDHCLSLVRAVDRPTGAARYGRMFPGLGPLGTDPGLLMRAGGDGGICDAAPVLDQLNRDGDDATEAAGWPFFGQLIAHDITADRSSITGGVDPEVLRNARSPKLNLEIMYSDGPIGSPYLFDVGDPAKFLLGEDGGDAPRNRVRTAGAQAAVIAVAGGTGWVGKLVVERARGQVPAILRATQLFESGPASQRPPEWRNPRTEPAPDFANLPAPAEGILVTLFITVRDVARSRDFYARVLGGTVVLNENPCIVRLSNSWIIMNPGGPPTPDKPGISVVDYQPGDTTSIFLNLRVADIRACYEQWKANGAQFLTPPIDRASEIRCYLRDPDGYLIEIGQSTGLLQDKRAMTHPHDPTS